MKTYTNFKEIENDLILYKLQRDIAWEELKLVKSEFKQDLNPLNWVSTALKFTGKYSFIALLRKMFFK